MKAVLPRLVLGRPAGVALPDRVPVVVIDNRVFPRLPFRVAGTVEDDYGAVDVLTRDISLGGAFVELAVPVLFCVNNEVVVRLNQLPTPLAATVRWIDSAGLGLQFHPIEAWERHALSEIVTAATERG